MTPQELRNHEQKIITRTLATTAAALIIGLAIGTAVGGAGGVFLGLAANLITFTVLKERFILTR